MSFISATYNKYKNLVSVWERDTKGIRRLKQYKAPFYFYVPDKNGQFLSIQDIPLKKITFNSKEEFDEACLSYNTKFESDISPLEKCLMDNYYGLSTPVLNVGFLDIEVDYDKNMGFSNPENPYAPINALTLYSTKDKKYYTLLVPPDTWDGSFPSDLLNDNYIIVKNEKELLDKFIKLIEDIDVLSGWNSDFFDLPYIAKRLEMIFGEIGLKSLEFDKSALPRYKEIERFKGANVKSLSISLYTRVHLDYMRLFKNFNLEGRQSYSLAAISEAELNEAKMTYDGSLYDLYRNDFVKFSLYNRHDVRCIVKLDGKFKYIQIANEMVHEGTVNFNSIFGSVQLIDTTIINFCHKELNRIIFDKVYKSKVNVEGALVMTPKIGLHKYIASCDINSLYPSTYRSLNLSPEKIIGQLNEKENGWRAVQNYLDDPLNDTLKNKSLNVLFEGSDEDIIISVEEFINFLKENKFALSAYGTILDQRNGEGLIPKVLTFWFKKRKELQAKKKEHLKLADEILNSVKDKNDSNYIKHLTLSEFYDVSQGVKKVQLNSLYGATLNEFCRFFDPRLGASCTGSGRQITTHMIEKISKLLLDDKAPKLKKTTIINPKNGEVENVYEINSPPGIGPIYSDTDSCYFVLENLVNNDPDTAVVLADAIVEQVNDSFSGFMSKSFFCQPGFDNLIKANREIVAKSGIWRRKKKYIVLIHDKEGRKFDSNDDKALYSQGSDIKLSSTPERIRKMLKDVTLMILKGEKKQIIDDYIIDFRTKLNNIENNEFKILDFATVTSIKTIDEYFMKWNNIERKGLGKVNMPGNARASINYNYILEILQNKNLVPITSGQKIKIIWLKENEFNFKSIAFPSEFENLPDWFNQRFEVDLNLTEKKLVDKKIDKIFSAIGWQVPTFHSVIVNNLLSFED